MDTSEPNLSECHFPSQTNSFIAFGWTKFRILIQISQNYSKALSCQWLSID